MKNAALAAAMQFDIAREVSGIAVHGRGLINDTYKLEAGGAAFLLQRINERVFPRPHDVMHNLEVVADHLETVAGGQIETPRPVRTRSGALLVEDGTTCWRLFEFIGGICRDQVESAEMAESAAEAFGKFQLALSDLDPGLVRQVLPGFHDFRRRYEQFEDALAGSVRADEAVHEIELARIHAGLLAEWESRGADLPVRVVHNDAKIGNVIFDRATGMARWIVDLDTVMPGCALVDFGDLVRSMVSGGAEDDPRVCIESEIHDAVERGFCRFAPLTEDERTLLPLAAACVVYEQALRFLADFLSGDTYYRVAYELQNLMRCRRQFEILGHLRC